MRKNIFGSILLFILLLSSCTMVAEHEWTPWVVTKEPTCMEEGEKAATCVLCDEVKTEKLAKIDHKLDEHNKCTMCGKYYVRSSAGTGETLEKKLEAALQNINSTEEENAVIYLEGGEYDLSTIGAIDIKTNGLTIHGAAGTDESKKTTFKVPSSKGLSVSGDSFSLDNVSFTVTDGESSAASQPVLTLSGNNATISNSSFDLSSHDSLQAIGDIAESQTVTLKGVTINGGSTLKSSGTLEITDSNIKTASSPAVNADKGSLTVKNSTVDGGLTTGDSVTKLTIEGSSTIQNGEVDIKGGEIVITDSELSSISSLSINSNDVTISGSTIKSDSAVKITGTSGSKATITNSIISGSEVAISSDTNTITGKSTITGTTSIEIAGTSESGGKTDITGSTLTGGTVKISTADNTITNSTITSTDSSIEITGTGSESKTEIKGSNLSGKTVEISSKTSTITDSTIKSDSTVKITGTSGSEATITNSDISGSEVAISSDTNTITGKSTITGTNSIEIAGTSDSGGKTDITGSTLTGGTVKISTDDNTITDSTITSTDSVEIAGAGSGSKTEIKGSSLSGKTVEISSDTNTITDKSTITGTDSMKITGTSESGTTTKIDGSSLTGGSVKISSETNTITGSKINEGQKDNTLVIGGKTAEISSSVLDGKITIGTAESTTIEKDSKVNGSDTKAEGSFVVTDGKITISDSTMGGNITIEKGADSAKIENSLIDTSDGSNAITTGVDLTIGSSTIKTPSGLYVDKDVRNIDISITNSRCTDGSNPVDIKSDTAAEVFKKEVPTDKKNEYIQPWDNLSTANFKVNNEYPSVPFTFKDTNGTEVKVNLGKEGDSVDLNNFFTTIVDGYVSPEFYTDSNRQNKITDSKIWIKGENKYSTAENGATVEGPVYVKWEYKVSYTDGNGETKTATTTNGGELTIDTPTKDGKLFDHWVDVNGNRLETTEAEDGKKVTAKLTSPSTLTPIFVTANTVSFNTNGGQEVSTTLTVKTGSTISSEQLPTPKYNEADDYTFDKWCTDQDCTKEFTCGSDKIEEDTTLYAKWKIVITVNGQTYTSSENTTSGIQTSSLTQPTKDGCSFKGWYTNSNLTEKAPDTITKNMTLYPAYECAITVKTSAGETTTDKLTGLKVDEGKTLPADFFTKGSAGTTNTYISKTNRYFAGWCTEDGKDVTAGTVITKNTTLKAKWNVSYTIDGNETVIAEGGSVKVSDLTAGKTKNRSWVKSVTWSSNGTQVAGDSVSITTTKQALTYTEEYYQPTFSAPTSGVATVKTAASVNPSTGVLTFPTYNETSGYTFDGWYKADTTTKVDTPNYKVSSSVEGTTLTPVWSKEFTITYELDDSIGKHIITGGLGTDTTQKYTRYYGVEALNKETNLKSLSNSAYAYTLEWKESGSDTTTYTTTLPATVKKDITLVSSWKITPEVDDMILAGEYNNTPLEWYIIHIDTTNKRMLVLSRYALDHKALDTNVSASDGTYKWSTSTLDGWFRSDDNDAFAKTYKFYVDSTNMVPVARVTNTTKSYSINDKNSKTATGGQDSVGNEAIFLLSYNEYTAYGIDTKTYRDAYWIDRPKTDGENYTVSWWLRTPIRSYYTIENGQVSTTSYAETNYAAMCVAGGYIYSDNGLKTDSFKNKDSTETVNTGNLAVYSNDRFIRPAFWYKYE